MAGEIVQRPARGHHVDEPEQRRLELAIAGGKLHRARVQRAHRMPGARRKRGSDLAADAVDLALQRLALGSSRLGSSRRQRHRLHRGRRGVLDRVPADVVGAHLLVDGSAAAQAEQALRIEQIDDHGDVDDEADQLQRRESRRSARRSRAATAASWPRTSGTRPSAWCTRARPPRCPRAGHRRAAPHQLRAASPIAGRTACRARAGCRRGPSSAPDRRQPRAGCRRGSGSKCPAGSTRAPQISRRRFRAATAPRSETPGRSRSTAGRRGLAGPCRATARRSHRGRGDADDPASLAAGAQPSCRSEGTGAIAPGRRPWRSGRPAGGSQRRRRRPGGGPSSRRRSAPSRSDVAFAEAGARRAGA